MEEHEQKGPLSEEDKRLMDHCLLERDPEIVASWSVQKRLRGVMYALKLPDFPHGWRICNDTVTPCNMSLEDLVQIARAEEVGEGHHKLAAKSAVRILLRALVISGLLTCNSSVPRDPNDPQAASAASEVFCLSSVVDAERCLAPTGDAVERHNHRLQRRLSIQQSLACRRKEAVPGEPMAQVYEKMQLLMQMAASSPSLAWQNSFIQQCPKRPKGTTEASEPLGREWFDRY